MAIYVDIPPCLCDKEEGTNGSDLLIGTSSRDFLKGLNGRDTLYGEEDNDRLSGGGHADLIRGGDGDDFIRGGTGKDQLYGDAGDDIILGGSGRDYISGGEGDDLLKGGSGNDVFVFEPDPGSTDTIIDFSAGDTLKFDMFNLTPFGFGMSFDQVGADVHVVYHTYFPGALAAPSAIGGGGIEDLVAIVLNANADLVRHSVDDSGSFV